MSAVALRHSESSTPPGRVWAPSRGPRLVTVAGPASWLADDVRFEEDPTWVLTALDDAGVRYWVAGGWGVAVLAGRQTRNHRDLDLAVDAEDLIRCIEALDRIGYVTRSISCQSEWS